jgi:hypothetical protein
MKVLKLAAAAMVFAALVGGSAQAAAAPNTLTVAEKAAGWRLLFNGRDMSGWRTWKGPGVRPQWKIDDQAIMLSEGGGGDIVTEDSFKDFELKFDWRIAPGGNSGVMYFVRETPDAQAPWHTGPELQILDNAGHPDGKNGPERQAGALYDLVPAAKDVTRPVGQWNEARVVVKDGRIEHWLNGSLVVSTPWGEDQWAARVRDSKFAAMAEFGKVAEGRIALQDHGDKVWYRNIKLRPLP